MTETTSVIIPVRNGAQFVAEAVDSVLSQLATEDRILVVDDASTDETRAVLAAIGDARIVVLDGDGRGVSSARNIGLAAARSEFVAFLDHDDTWPPGRHAFLFGFLGAHPDYDAVFGRLKVRLESDTPSVIRAQVDRLDNDNLIPLFIWTGLYRKTFLDRVGGFAEDVSLGEDTDFSLRLMEAGMRWRICDVDAISYRRHGRNVSNDHANLRAAQFNVLARKIARARARKATE
jgi:glycosyltransferase involved in cell wall biosynthesis